MVMFWWNVSVTTPMPGMYLVMTGPWQAMSQDVSNLQGKYRMWRTPVGETSISSWSARSASNGQCGLAATMRSENS
ncbi:hypothetical protein BE21_49355 [Sorangium cellulosum]|uniref:Uncharacterized protein n=1 Tax=Sorangium cellulosum TaxID=56 RepID=A0A150TGX0_SORCE|nr:hypothetical protein BE21_49355 [Sorangium cellulosum]